MKKTHQTSRPRQLAFVNLILIVFLVAQSLMPVLVLATPTLPATTYSKLVAVEDKEGDKRDNGTEVIYRTRIVVDSPARWEKVDNLGVVVLAQEGEEALVLVDQEQLETLARLRFEPHATDALETLVDAHARTHSGLVSSLQPLLAEAEAVAARPQNEPSSRGLVSLRAAIRATTPAQRASLAMLANVDSDGDGLNDTEEGWWCTDPNNPNSDGDAEGYTDGQEIYTLVSLRSSLQDREEYGPPFGPPNAWPDWNGQDGDPATPACNDGDYDTIPDQAEVFMVGSRVPEESTDGDKFDDGQELFGTTYCPGAPTSCGYGTYPRIEYWSYIKAGMPDWLDPPGDSIFVAAFPVPEVSVVPSSWRVERVTTVTTSEGQIVQTTNTYETSVMRGQGSSIADTVTWNEWEEVSESVETPISGNSNISLSGTDPPALIPIVPIVWAGATLVGTGFLTGFGKQIGKNAADDAYKWVKNKITGEDNKDDIQTQQATNKYKISMVNNVSSSARANASVTVNNNFDTQGIVNSLDGVQYAINQQGELLARGLYDISYAISQPRFTETRAKGNSWGGSQTTTHEVYEEHTISEGQAFTSGQNWETAWAVDSSHAADLTFSYTIGNSGTDYARELSGLNFNIYLGDDTEPSITYKAWEQFSNGKIENLFPGDTIPFTSSPIALTLQQMKRIDLGERLRVVVADYSYGADELFYQNAVNGGITVFIEDGVDDGDELVDSYVIPTWGNESVQKVLKRYFPAGYDDEGNLNALWTPEFGNNALALRQAASQPTWQEHYLSDISWWNVYLTQSDAGNTPLQDLAAEAGSALLFRFNRDSDRDGYKDSVELRYGTDKDDAASHPQPEVLAGYVVTREGNQVTVLLKLANTGTFDAYGIDAVMYSPDGTTTIDNNTVGGNGKVRPAAQVAVGTLVKLSDLGSWDNSTGAAKPYASGNYTGDTDRTYTFSVTTAGVIGQSGTAMSWSDGAGSSGTLDLGSNYQAPLPIEVAEGLEIGFNTGTIGAGTSFTVDALTPRDTFKYTINSEPYTPPVIVVSYSDPQGSHRFITPVELDDLASDLIPYGGQMLTGAGLDIITHDAVEAATANTTTFVFNNPHPSTLEDANLYLNFVSDGQLVAEMPFTLTLEAGPTISPVTWSTDAFSQTYNAEADNILLAFWTDSEGNIIDSAARPLNTFADDPQPAFASDTSLFTWDFGSAAQGELLNHTLTLANTGFATLLTHVNAPAGITISQANTGQLAPADNNEVAISLDTTGLPTGAYSQTLTLRTSDPDNPTYTIQVVGTITDDAPVARAVPYRPLDLTLTIPGDHEQGEWIEFPHPLGPDMESLHPVKVYDQDHQTLLGTGRYATDFGNGTHSTSSKVFRDLQTIPTEGAEDWEFFTIDNDYYLAVANRRNNSTRNINSKIYRWNGTDFEEFQSIATNGAIEWEFFSIGSESYLAVANLRNNSTYNVNSKIYRWNGRDFEEFQSIATNGAAGWEFFSIGSESYLAVANYYNNSTHNINSKIYRWNGTTFEEFQSIPTSGAGDWVFFTIGSTHYLAVNNFYNNSTYNVNSKIYRWNGTSFEEFQSIPTNGAHRWEFFSIGSESYLAGANFYSSTYNVNSKIYRWNGTSFEEFQSIPTNGAKDWEFFTIGRDHYLAVTNYYNDSTHNLNSKIYRWNGTSFEEFQSIPTNGARDWLFFTIGSDKYMVVANYYNGSYNINSKIYKWDTGFEEFQSIPTSGASDWEFFTIGSDNYLAAANKRNDSTRNIDSKLYQWDGTSFAEFQSVPTNGAVDWEFFTIGSEHYLAVANNSNDSSNNINSKLYQWDGTRFSEFQSIPTNSARDWEFFTIGSDHYLAVANERNASNFEINSKLYQWDGTSFVQFQSIPTTGAFDWEFFTIGSEHYLVVANHYHNSGHNTVSKIYQWNGASFVEYQSIPTFGPLDWKFFTVDNDFYLIVANHPNHEIPTTKSKLYKWNGTSFVEYQSIFTWDAYDWEFFTTGSDKYLAVAQFQEGNHFFHSKLYNWDGTTAVEYQSIPTTGAVGWEFFTIGSDHYLAVVNHENGSTYNIDSKVYVTKAAYIVEQLATALYNKAQLNLPESFTDGRTYKVQYGRRLVFDSAGEQTTTLRVPAESFNSATLDALVSDILTDSLSLGLDIGNDGSWDWQATQSVTNTATLASSNLAEAFNAYWTSQGSPISGTLDVPVRVSLSDEGQVLLTNLVMTPALPDVSLSVSDITFGASSPIEGDSVPISAMLHNPDQLDSGALTVGFYATVPDFGDWYIGSAFVPNIAANGSVEADIQWNTLGFTGEVPVKVVVDPFNRLSESNEDNNQATKSMTILTRPDLMVSGIALEGAARQGLPVNVAVAVYNSGDTDAETQRVSLYNGDPDDGGTLIGSADVAVAAGTTETLSISWTPATLGSLTLYAQADSEDAISESDESNNLTSQEVYVGWGAPVEIDAGGTGDQAYDPDDGYGYLAPGTVLDSCGSEPEQTYRQAASGEALEYQFDHLLPGRFYHLDLTTFLCSGSRELRVLVDGIEVANPVTANNEVNRLSLLLDPALYADNQVVVSIERISGLGGPVVSELTLTDIRYCYRDGGQPQEVPYANAPDDCGWLNGTNDQGWGTLPHQSVRYNDTGDNIQYRFDALQADEAYQLNLTFYEGDGAGRVQSVLVDGQAVLSDIALSNTPQYLTVDVPASAYANGSILVEIAGDSLPIISEIALEQKTLGTSSSSTSIPLVPGWNLISIPVHPESTVPADVLASIEGNYSLVQRYDRCDVTEPWQTYDPNVPPIVNRLTAIDETMGLWIKLSVSDTLVVTGTLPISPSISLCTGWNLVGYPSLDSQPVTDALSSIGGSYTLVQAYFASLPTNDQWKTFDPQVPIIVNSLHDMTAGQGYWIKVSQDVEWGP